MYELPSLEGVSKVVIDEAVVEGGNEPYLVYEGGEPQRLTKEKELKTNS
jgi:ATP-dependent Clp protease ATP-binding subunit ClpX